MFEEVLSTVHGVSLLQSDVDTARFRVSSSVEETYLWEDVEKLVRRGELSTGYRRAVFERERTGEVLGAVIIEDWRAACFPREHVGSPGGRELVIKNRTDRRISSVKNDFGVRSFRFRVNRHTSDAGGGMYGQTQIVAEVL